MSKAERREENERAVESLLQPALEAAKDGDRAREEAAIAAAIGAAKKLPASVLERLDDTWPSYTRRRIISLVAAGRLRIDRPVLAEVPWLGGSYAKVRVFPGEIAVYDNTLNEQKVVRQLDRYVEIELETLGGIIENRRPTLTRMAVGSPLPGTAMIPGLAFQKTTFEDRRQAFLSIMHPEWVFHLPVHPDHAPAMKVFILATRRAIQELGADQAIDGPATLGAGAPIDELERLGRLRDGGVIDEAEFTALKQQVLG